MLTRKKTNKYILPALLAFVVATSVVAGVLYIRSYMMQQMFRERSSQLEEMLSQIRVNLDYGMETHWNLFTGIYNVIDGKHYDSEQELIGDIDATEKLFRTDLYDCRVMLLDSIGLAYICDGPVGIWDDIGYLADGASRHTFVSDTSNVGGTFLVFSQKLEHPITAGEDGNRFTHLILLKDIKSLKKYYNYRVLRRTGVNLHYKKQRHYGIL